VTVAASTALPYQHLERATAGLRAELRQKLLAGEVHQMPEWDTFTVTGPRQFTDLRGRTWVQAESGVLHPLLQPVQYVDLTQAAAAAWALGAWRLALGETLLRVDAAGGYGWPDDRSPFPGCVR
jgi:hypothetical protein